MSYYLRLIRSFAFTDFKLRYQGSFFGYFWSLLNPLLTFLIFYFVFSYFVRFEMDHYPLFLLIGIVIWNFFNEGTTNAIAALYAKSNILKKIYFPRTTLIIASNFTTSIVFFLSFVVFLLFYFLSGFTFNLILFSSVLFLINLFFLTLGVSYLVSALNLRFSDVQHIWRILLQLFFWLTPVVYPVTKIPEQFHFLVNFNPMALIIEGFRTLFLSYSFSFYYYFLSLFFSLLILIIGHLVYKKMSLLFAEWV